MQLYHYQLFIFSNFYQLKIFVPETSFSAKNDSKISLFEKCVSYIGSSLQLQVVSCQEKFIIKLERIVESVKLQLTTININIWDA